MEKGRLVMSRIGGWSMTLLAVLVAAVLAVVGVAVWFGLRGDSEPGSAASCSGVLRFDGHAYLPHGPLVRVPRAGRSVGPAEIPACDDGAGGSPARHVVAYAVQGVEPAVAVMAGSDVYVRVGRLDHLPASVRQWREPVRCTAIRPFTVSGTLIGFGDAPVDVDFDVHPPYTMTLVTGDGGALLPGDTYSSVAIDVRVTGSTRRGSDVALLRAAVTQARRVSVGLTCDGGGFRATTLEPAAPRATRAT